MAAKQYRRLPYTFTYLFAFFLLADGLNTTGSVVGIVQNQQIEFSFLRKLRSRMSVCALLTWVESTYLGIAQASTSIFSCYAFWYLQKYKSINTKRMFQVTNVITILIPFWGMVSLRTSRLTTY